SFSPRGRGPIQASQRASVIYFCSLLITVRIAISQNCLQVRALSLLSLFHRASLIARAISTLRPDQEELYPCISQGATRDPFPPRHLQSFEPNVTLRLQYRCVSHSRSILPVTFVCVYPQCLHLHSA